MSIQVQLVGRNDRVVEISKNGELVTAPLEYSAGVFQKMDAAATAYNFHKPTTGKRFVITGFIISTNRNVGVNGANIVIYEASALDSITVDRTVLEIDMVKNDILPILGANFILTVGVFLNGKTDDADVLVTIAGYEVDA